MKRAKKLKPYLMVMPVVFVILFVFISGISGAFLQSLGYFPFIGMKEISFKYYIEIFCEKDFTDSLLFTLYISFVSAIFSIILGIFFARIFSKREYKNDFVSKIPIAVPHITVALFAITLLSDTGFFARIFSHLGLNTKVFENLIYSSNGIGIIFAFLWKQIPYACLSCLSILKNISTSYEKAAINLGASKTYAFFKVTLPMLFPTIISCFTIIFSFAFGSYELYFLLGPTKPKSMAVKAMIEYTNPLMENRPKAMAVNMVMILFVIIFVILFDIIIKKMVMGKNYEK